MQAFPCEGDVAEEGDTQSAKDSKNEGPSLRRKSVREPRVARKKSSIRPARGERDQKSTRDYRQKLGKEGGDFWRSATAIRCDAEGGHRHGKRKQPKRWKIARFSAGTIARTGRGLNETSHF